MTSARIVGAACGVAILLAAAWFVLDTDPAEGDATLRLAVRDGAEPATMTLAVPRDERDAVGPRVTLPLPERNAEPERLASASSIDLHGVVLDESGEPLPQAHRVRLSGESGPTRTVALDAEARFVVDVPRDDALRLRASVEGFVDVNARWSAPDGSEAFVELRLSRRGRVEGRLVFDDGRPAGGAGVRVELGAPAAVTPQRADALVFVSALPSALFASADLEGRFAFEAPEVVCRVVPLRVPAQPPVLGVRDEAPSEESDADVELDLAWSARALTIVPTPGATRSLTLSVPRQPGLSGRVVRAGVGVPGIVVDALPVEAGFALGLTTTDAAGTFHFEALEPGRVRLVVRSENPTVAHLRRVREVSVPARGEAWIEIEYDGPRVLLDPVDARTGQSVYGVLLEMRAVDVLPPGVELDRRWESWGSGWDNVLDALPPGVYEVAAVEIRPGDREALAEQWNAEEFEASGEGRPIAWAWDEDALGELAERATGRRAPPQIVTVVADPPDGEQRIVLEMR